MNSAPLSNLEEVFPTLRNKIYFASCSHGLMPQTAYDALTRYVNDLYVNGPDWDEYMRVYEETRLAFSKMINASPDEIALVPTVSYGINAIISSLRSDSGRNRIIVSRLNFPTVIYAWESSRRRLGFRVVSADGSLEDYIKKLDDKTLAISLTHVHYITGFREYLEEVVDLAHERGSIVILDDAQATGVIPLDVKKLDVDILVTTCSKYLLGLPGLAFLFVRRSLVEELTPLITSWFAHKEPFKFSYELELSNTARRFEIGTPPIPSIIACLEGIRFLSQVGVENVWKHVKELSMYLLEKLQESGFDVVSPLNEERRGAHIAIRVNNAERVAEKLRENNIVVSPRSGIIRVSLHIYNTHNNIDSLVDLLNKLRE